MRGEDLKIKRIDRTRVWERVADQLQDLILSGHWKAGDKLPSETTLAGSFGVSRASLREALRQLGSLGLVEMRQGEGNYVSTPDLAKVLSPLEFALIEEHDNLLAIMETRRMIEVGTAGLAAIRASDKDRQRLSNIFEQMLAAKDDLESFAKADHAFHRQIALSTKNTVIIKIYDAIDMLLVHQQLEIVELQGALERGLRDHDRILQAIITGDGTKASDIMQIHLDNTHEAIIKARENKETSE